MRVGDKNKDAVLGGALDEEGGSDSDSEAEAAAASIRKKTREANPLLVDLEEKKELSGSALASQWFSQVRVWGVPLCIPRVSREAGTSSCYIAHGGILTVGDATTLSISRSSHTVPSLLATIRLLFFIAPENRVSDFSFPPFDGRA